ncbi:MAG: cyclic nucleotide-binding domain-containing protein [Armatimonadetes bacterium]|nr:cyclic nucleotide-binding domain-containing protein [Armatimonadota bacterium]
MLISDALFKKLGKTLPRGALLFNQGDTGAEMYIIVSGNIAIRQKLQDREQLLATLGPGDFLGERALITNTPRMASADAASDAKLLIVDRRTFETVFKKDPRISMYFTQKLLQRMQSGAGDKAAEAEMSRYILQKLEEYAKT